MWQWAQEEADTGLGHGSRKDGSTRKGGRLNNSLPFSKLNKHIIMILFHCLCINILLKEKHHVTRSVMVVEYCCLCS